jgi:hypothetical protein
MERMVKFRSDFSQNPFVECFLCTIIMISAGCVYGRRFDDYGIYSYKLKEESAIANDVRRNSYVLKNSDGSFQEPKKCRRH